MLHEAFYRPVAQRLEPSAHNGLVGGSIPSGPTNLPIILCQKCCSYFAVQRRFFFLLTIIKSSLSTLLIRQGGTVMGLTFKLDVFAIGAAFIFLAAIVLGMF